MDHLIDDSDRLKPCPFCGGSASMVYVDRGHDAGGRYIACDACDASTGLRFACGDDPTPLLVEQWNKRHVQAPHDLLRDLSQVCQEVNDHTPESWLRAVLRIGNAATILLRPNVEAERRPST